MYSVGIFQIPGDAGDGVKKENFYLIPLRDSEAVNE
jgi:hypothetical protein